MKRSLILAAVATLASGTALAQSSVTVYGRLNVSAERQKVVNATTGVEQDVSAIQNSASRIGFKGTEDLGGGLKAFFLIESGFSPDTGAASSTFWGRESNVGLMGDFGKFRIGNMGPTAAYFALADYISNHNHDTGTSEDALYLYPGNARNMVAYATPSIAGFSGEVQYGLKETGAKNTGVLRADYDAGPLHVGIGYVNGPIFFPGAGGTNAGKEFGIRGLYEMGPLTFGAYYINDKGDNVPLFGSIKRNSFRASVMYVMGASEFHLNVGKAGKLKADAGDIAGSDATQATIAYNYNLSKRTKVYAFYTKLGGDGAPAYAVSNADFGNGGVKNSFAVGVRHNF